jgi:hypothetical protein
MRVNDIILETTLTNEAPAGLIGQGLKRVGAKLAGAVGMKGTAANLTGKADAGKEANALMVDLKGYLGRTGGNIKQVDAGDLTNFLQQKGYPTSAIQGLSGILTTQQVDQTLLKTVQAKAKAGGIPASTQSEPSAQKGGVVSNFKAGFASASGKTAQQSADEPTAPAAGTTTTSQGVPPALIKKITQLSAQEKKQLIGML